MQPAKTNAGNQLYGVSFSGCVVMVVYVGKHFITIVGNQDGMLKLGRKQVVGRAGSPAIRFVNLSRRPALVDHWFDCKDHSGLHNGTGIPPGGVVTCGSS